MVLKRTMVVALPLSNILDGSALRDIPGHYEKVVYRWMGAWLGLNLVSSSLFRFLVQFSSRWAMFISSSSSIIDSHSLLVIIYFFFFVLQGYIRQVIIIVIITLRFFFLNLVFCTLSCCFPFLVFDFLECGGASLSDLSLSCDLFLSFFLDLLCGLPANLLASTLPVFVDARQGSLYHTKRQPPFLCYS